MGVDEGDEGSTVGLIFDSEPGTLWLASVARESEAGPLPGSVRAVWGVVTLLLTVLKALVGAVFAALTEKCVNMSCSSESEDELSGEASLVSPADWNAVASTTSSSSSLSTVAVALFGGKRPPRRPLRVTGLHLLLRVRRFAGAVLGLPLARVERVRTAPFC